MARVGVAVPNHLLKQACTQPVLTGQGGEQASSDSFEHAVQRIADWADNECMANLALYDRGGGLRLGRTGMEIWHSTVGEEASLALPPAVRHG